MEFNEKIRDMAPSKSIVFMQKAKALQKEDPGIISLAGGEPDFTTPKRIRDEVTKQLEKGYTHYTIGPGLPELRERIARKLREENGAEYDPDGVIVTPGGKFAIYLAVRSLVNPGDEVMFPEPGWVSYPSIVEASNACPVPVRLSGSDGFRLTRAKLEEKVSEKTRLLIVNYPNNPTGRVLSRPEAEELRAFMNAHPDVLLLSDEIYERILFEGAENVSPASYPDLRDRVITVNGFSKSVAMTGFRIGYLATTPEIAKVMYKLFQHTMSCTSGFIMKAALTALDCQEEIEEMRQEYERRRDAFIGALNEIPGVTAALPEGAFYAWVKFDMPGLDSEETAAFLLKEARVVGVPGNAYGTDETYVRFSFASSMEDLMESAKRIREAMEKG